MIDLPPRLQRALDNNGEGLHVLVLRLGAMGDILRTLPPVRMLRRRIPAATFGWVLDTSWEVLLSGHPDVELTIPVPRKEWDAARSSLMSWPALPAHIRRFKKRVASFNADVVLDFHGNLRTGWIGRWSGAAVRLGYAGHQQKEGNRWFTTHRVAAGVHRTPRMERNLDLVAALGVPREPLLDPGLTLPVGGREDAERIARTLPDSGRFAVLSPSVSVKQAYKKPPVELLAATIARLNERGLKTLVVWGPGEEEDAKRTVAAAGSAAILAPPTSLPVLAALIERATVFVSGDTGPMHLACSLCCPVLAFYGPTDPVVNRPWGAPFRTVYPSEQRYTGIKKLDREGGFEGIDEGQIARAVEEILAEAVTRR